MSQPVTPDVYSAETLSQIKEALADPNVSIKLPVTFTHGRGVQIYVKTRKVGPIILPTGDQTLADILQMIGSLAGGND